MPLALWQDGGDDGYADVVGKDQSILNKRLVHVYGKGNWSLLKEHTPLDTGWASTNTGKIPVIWNGKSKNWIRYSLKNHYFKPLHQQNKPAPSLITDDGPLNGKAPPKPPKEWFYDAPAAPVSGSGAASVDDEDQETEDTTVEDILETLKTISQAGLTAGKAGVAVTSSVYNSASRALNWLWSKGVAADASSTGTGGGASGPTAGVPTKYSEQITVLTDLLKASQGNKPVPESAAAEKTAPSAGKPASVCESPLLFDEGSFRIKLRRLINQSQTWLHWATGKVDTNALDFAKNRVHRFVEQVDGESCVWRGVMARNKDDIVIFFLNPATGKLGEEYDIAGWMKGWHTFGSTKAEQATKPKKDIEGSTDESEDKEKTGIGKEADSSPLNKQFTALFARLRDLEARLAPPQTPQIVRDARPVREHLDELREKIARTRSLISRDVAGLRRVHV